MFIKKFRTILMLMGFCVLSGCSSKNLDTYSSANKEAQLSQSTSVSSSTENEQSSSQEISTQQKNDKSVFENDIISISYNPDSNVFNVNNKTSNAITLTNDWKGPLINGVEINPFNGFAGVDIDSNSNSEEQVVLTYNDHGGQMTTDEKSKLVRDGDNILHVSGKIFNQSDTEEKNPISTFTFDVHIDGSKLK